MSDVYKVNSYEVLGNLSKRLAVEMGQNKDPIVTISYGNLERSKAQNRTMHMWFRDIAKSTGHGVVYEAGRCKIQYFLPRLRSSDKEQAQFAIQLCEFIFMNRGHEYLIEALGRSMIESTRHLTTEQFSEALSDMRENEAHHNLTDPAQFGYEV